MAKHRNPRKKSSLARRRKGKKSQWAVRSLNTEGDLVEVQVPFAKQ
jgi:hypothetical protein